MSGTDTRKEHRLFQLPVNPVSPYRNARLFPVGDRSRESVVDFPFICCATLLDNTGYSRIGISRQIHYAQTTNVAGISVLKGFALGGHPAKFITELSAQRRGNFDPVGEKLR